MNDSQDDVTRLQVEALGLKLVRVRAAANTVVGASTVAIPTGVVTIHLGQLDVPPTGVFVAGVAETFDSVAQLYGVSAAEAVEQLAQADDGTIDVVFEPGDEQVIADMVHLGVLRWLQTCAPLSLDTRLLNLEEKLLAARLEHHVDAEQQFEQLIEVCEETLEAMRSRPMGFPPVVSLLSSALEQIVVQAPAFSERIPWAHAQLAWLEQWEVGEPGGITIKAVPVWCPSLALAASGDMYAGAATVDWNVFPRGWVSYAENNASWQLKFDGDSAYCTVVVNRPEPIKWFGEHPEKTEPTAADRFGFLVFAGQWPVPLLLGVVNYQEDSDSWVGHASADGAAGRRLSSLIDQGHHVRLRCYRLGSPADSESDVTAAVRWESRGIAALRLWRGSADSGMREAAISSLEAAGESWTRAGMPDEAAECSRLVGEARRESWGVGVRLSVAEQWLLADQS